MRGIIGTFLLGLAAIGYLYLRNYSGTVITNVFVWLIVDVLIGLCGARLIILSIQKRTRLIEDELSEKRKARKKSADVIAVAFDNCEFSDRAYSEEVRDSRHDALKIFGSVSLADDKTVINNIEQSSLRYLHSWPEGPVYYLGSFPMGMVSLKAKVLSGKMLLVVDQHDKSNYHFEEGE